MTVIKPREPARDPGGVWQFAALDPFGAHNPGQVFQGIVERYAVEGQAMARLEKFAVKQYRAPVRTRKLATSAKNHRPCVIRDVRFRWRNGAPGYACIRQIPDDGAQLVDDEE